MEKIKLAQENELVCKILLIKYSQDGCPKVNSIPHNMKITSLWHID